MNNKSTGNDRSLLLTAILAWLLIILRIPASLGQSVSTETERADSSVTNTFISLCAALRDNYPMLENAGWNESWVADFGARVAAAPTRQAAFDIMDALVNRLNDYHTRLILPHQHPQASPPCAVEPVFEGGSVLSDHADWETRPTIEMPSLDGIAIAVIHAGNQTGLQPGDEILSVDGVPLAQCLSNAWPHSACSSAFGKLRVASGRMLRGSPRSEVKLEVRRQQTDGAVRTLTVAVSRINSALEPAISSREVDKTPVIRISRWAGRGLVEQFDALLKQFRNRPALIIDVRGNGGGEDELASQVVGRFISAQVIASISFHRQVPNLTFERTVEISDPRGPWRYAGRVAVLTDEGCMSACEHFVSGMVEAGALICGTPTSGACGWIRPVTLPGGLRLNVSETFPLHAGGLPSPLLGIAPHLWAPRTLGDLRAGKDTGLLAAIQWLKSDAPLPARLQPISTLGQSDR
ncbi:MAG TPA: S41 family peptidase [Verrucomicrobiae bacterium]|nr:S41 family peptidase [Verrucomicrobiae bacterium]